LCVTITGRGTLLLKERYLIEKELGRGGIGIVYLASDIAVHSCPVVIKVLSEAIEDSSHQVWFQEKFRQEIKALARIDHPGVVGVLDAGETYEGKPFLVMQYIDGVTLRSMMKEANIPPARVANIIRQMGQALNAAHEKGVFHRDLKPENVMLLSYSRGEAEQLATLVPESELKQSLDFEASRATAVDAELGQYRFVHFATPGYLDCERPELSALMLSLVDERGVRQDRFLRTHEIYNLNRPAEMVALSACKTELGKEIRGEGLTELTRGFQYAVTPRVVVILWNLNDRATAELMAKFYRKLLKDGLRP